MQLRPHEGESGDGHETGVSQDVKAVVAQRSSADLEFLSGLIEAGKITPVIDRTCLLSEVPAAIGYLETGDARGKIVITV